MSEEKDKRKIWRIREMDRANCVVPDSTRYTPAMTRKEAKELYLRKYGKKYANSRLAAIVMSRHMSEWVGDEDEVQS